MSGEFAFIDSLRALARHPAARDLKDDCAVLQVGRETLVLTHDMMIEGVHFFPDQDLADVAWKLVAVNLSDLASKGTEPLGILLGYTLGSDDQRFVAGLEEALASFAVPLLGGDTVSGGPPRSYGLTAIGRATCCPVPSRAGARPGDTIWITGPVGGAMLGFEALRAGKDADSALFRRPRALIEQGQALALQVTAMMDVSDGLLLDSWRMAEASNVSFRLDPPAIPVADSSRLDECIRWGDDYQLLFTLPASSNPPVPATRIGHVETENLAPLWLGDTAFTSNQDLGYTHRSAD